MKSVNITTSCIEGMGRLGDELLSDSTATSRPRAFIAYATQTLVTCRSFTEHGLSLPESEAIGRICLSFACQCRDAVELSGTPHLTQSLKNLQSQFHDVYVGISRDVIMQNADLS